jgi:hypothetical protein
LSKDRLPTPFFFFFLFSGLAVGDSFESFRLVSLGDDSAGLSQQTDDAFELSPSLAFHRSPCSSGSALSRFRGGTFSASTLSLDRLEASEGKSCSFLSLGCGRLPLPQKLGLKMRPLGGSEPLPHMLMGMLLGSSRLPP